MTARVTKEMVSPHPFRPKLKGPRTERPRHLIDCNIRVYALSEDDSQRLWIEIMRKALASKCKSISTFNCASGTEILPTSLVGKAVNAAKGKDIAIIMFYHRVQERVDDFVRRLREANSNLYVVFVSGSDFVGTPASPGGAFDMPGKGIADLVVGKNQLNEYQDRDPLSPWFANHLTAMLANAPISQK